MEMSHTGFFSMRESALNIHFTDKNLAVSINFIELVCYYCTFSIHYELFMFKTDSVTHCSQWMTVLTNLDRAFIVVGLIKEQGVGGGRK